MENYAKKLYLNLKNDYRHIICILVTLIFLMFSIFEFTYSMPRILESLYDLKSCFLYWLDNILELNLNGKIKINELSSLPLDLPFNLPKTWDEFKVVFGDYWDLIFDSKNFKEYISFLGKILYYLSQYLLMLTPFYFLFTLLFILKDNNNNNYNEDSNALKWWKKNIENKIYHPIKKWIKNFILFLNENPKYKNIWLFIWIFNFNFIAIFIEFISYYLYTATSIKLTTLYIQLIKLLMDLSIMINFIPKILWIIIAFYIFDFLRKKIGYSNLEIMESRDRIFINERPIVLMYNGTMGSKKTTAITDIALSQEIMFRDKAFEKILENDLKFPYFPWINLENDLKKAIKNHSVYNLATCKRYAKSKMKKFNKKPIKRNIYMYDFEKYGLYYDNKLFISNIWDVIENYCQLYFIYIIESSLLISNYSIRVDNVLMDLGNFPLWNVDLFKRDSRLVEAYSRHSHILDFDMLRLGKRVIEENNKRDCFEFGVINITEIGKERGNIVELRDLKKSDLNSNQKNDLFNTWLKMIRHSATVDNYPFVRVICDDQRPESWGADARDLCELVYIDKCSSKKLAMPLFFVENFLINKLVKNFKNKYYEFRFNRGDNTLLMYLYHGIIAKITNYQNKIYNTFGYYKLDISIESGKLDGVSEETNYYLMFKKIYSKRFSTDCFSGFFEVKALRSDIGVNDLVEFKKEKASFEEMLYENSFFFMDLMKIFKEENQE